MNGEICSVCKCPSIILKTTSEKFQHEIKKFREREVEVSKSQKKRLNDTRIRSSIYIRDKAAT